MKRKFLKCISIKAIIEFLIKKLWIIVLSGVVAAGLGFAVSTIFITGGSNENFGDEKIESIELIDGNYVYTTLVNVRAVKSESDEVISKASYVGLMISKQTISAAIENLGLTENVIDIVNKMSWEIIGETITLKISSPVQEVDGYSWIQVLEEIVKQGEITIKKYYSVVEDVIVIDEPYMENAIRMNDASSIDTAGEGINVIIIILAAFGGIFLSSVGLLLYYLFREEITYAEEIEENLDIPVLVIVEKKAMKGK